MNLFRAIALFYALLFCGCSDKIIRIVKTRPFQPEWQFTESGKNNWLLAQVPGLVHTDLLNNGKISDPLFDSNEHRLQWISESDWKYKAVFTISDSLMKFKSVDFIFKGIDTYATVKLNDSTLLTTDNMFREWRVDGKRFLKKGKNEMVVILHAPALRAMTEMQKLPYK